MVKLLKYFLYFMFFIFTLIYFMPKENLYFYAEEKLKEQKIIFSSETTEDTCFGISVKDARLSYESIESADIKEMSLSMFVFYNSLDIQNVQLSNAAASFIPQKIENINAVYSVFNPLKVSLKANGEFGNISGYVDILDRKIKLVLEPSKIMKSKFRNTLNYFKKNKNGEYSYEQNI